MDRKKLLIKFHTVCSLKGINADEKEAMLDGFGVKSSGDLGTRELISLIERIQGAGTKPELDKWRKRVMAAIGAWLRGKGISDNDILIKSIANRAASASEFNRIPLARLKQIYFEFVRKEQVHSLSEIIKQEILDHVSARN